MFNRTFVTQMQPGSSSGKTPLADPHIIPWRREHKGTTPGQKKGISLHTARANRLARNANKARKV